MDAYKKRLGLISVCLILVAWIYSNPLQAQDTKPKYPLLVGAGIGFCGVACRELGKTVGDLGPSLSVIFGFRLSEKSSLQLEYIVSHPNDEEPRTSDLMVITTVGKENTYHRFETVRSPKVYKTKLLLLSFQRKIFRDFFYRIGVGLGGNYYNGYYTSEDAVLDARIYGDGGYALGLAGGYERRVSDRLSLAIEASVRWSSGEDSTSARFVFGLGTVVKWEF